MVDYITKDKNIVRFSEDTICYLLKPFDIFDINMLEVTVLNNQDYFQTYYAYSFDSKNFSDFVLKEDFGIVDNIDTIPVYIAIKFVQTNKNPYFSITLYPEKNIDSLHKYIELSSIVYNTNPINIYYDNEVRYQTIYDIINEFPRWNFYDNQQISIDRWKAQCNSMSEMYGHICIYFKTEPNENETIHTLANNVIRNVIDVKKINIMAPGNELPQDRVVYSEWDMPLQDDFLIHIIKDKFEQAFGNVVPLEKDYLYLPIINKMFRVAAIQPKNGFMGQIGWWETFLSKYEEDDSVVSMDDELKQSLEGMPDFDEAIDTIELIDQVNEFKFDTVNTAEKIAQDTIEEKKESNENYSNKLVDSKFYVSLKETDKQREFYDRRLKIISVNPDDSSFPITMYNNSTVEKRVVAMQYNLKDYTTKNKFNLTITNNFEFSFNYVALGRFVGEVFDLLGSGGVLSHFTIRNNRNRFEIIDNRDSQKTFLIDYKIVEKEIYNIWIGYSVEFKQFTIKIFSLINKEKTLEYQNIYINSGIEITDFDITHIQLFGGSFLSSEIIFNNEDKNILKDTVNPLLVMKNF